MVQIYQTCFRLIKNKKEKQKPKQTCSKLLITHSTNPSPKIVLFSLADFYKTSV